MSIKKTEKADVKHGKKDVLSEDDFEPAWTCTLEVTCIDPINQAHRPSRKRESILFNNESFGGGQ